MQETSRREEFVSHLDKYLPKGASPVVYDWIRKQPFHLKITKPRATKLGDYRTPGTDGIHRITVNGNLNPFSFLVTLVHEIAHMDHFLDTGNLRNPHGQKWQAHYRKRFYEIAPHIGLPQDVATAIEHHLQSPAASSCADPALLRTLRKYDRQQVLTLSEIAHGTLFTLNGGKIFKKGDLRRTRVRCLDITSNRHYLIHADAEVVEVMEDNGRYLAKPRLGLLKP